MDVIDADATMLELSFVTPSGFGHHSGGEYFSELLGCTLDTPGHRSHCPWTTDAISPGDLEKVPWDVAEDEVLA